MTAIEILRESEASVVISKPHLVNAILELAARLERLEQKVSKLDKDSHGE